MTPERLVLDTDILIHLLKKQPQILTGFLRLLEARTVFLLSPIVVAEIYAGALEREYPLIESLFDFCERIGVDMEIGRLAGQYACRYRKAYQGISLEDYMLAATARKYRCPLWTGNSKHYPMKEVVCFDLSAIG